MKTTKDIAAQLREKLSTDIETEAATIAAHDCLAFLLKEKWNGKKLNARIADQFKERFFINAPELAEKAVVRLNKEYGMASLEIWGWKFWPNSSNRLRLFLGYDSEPTEPRLLGACINNYRASAFEETDCCHGQAARERNKKRIALCQQANGSSIIEELAAAIITEVSAREKQEAITEHGNLADVIRYDVRELADRKD